MARIELLNLETRNGVFDKERKVLTFTAPKGGYPTKLRVTSSDTHRTRMFVQDHAAAEANEFWDGELCEYIPEHGVLPNLKKIVLTAG